MLKQLQLLVLVIVLLLFPLQDVAANRQARAVDSAFGVNSHLASRYPVYETLGGPLDVVAQTGTGWAREDFQFSRMQPRPGQFDWGWHDRVVNDLSGRGIRVIGLLNGPTPAWAAGGRSGMFAPPDVEQFAAFAGAVVARYKDRVHYWQVWNEPDNAIYWPPAPNPAAYATLLRATTRAIKAADPNAQVLAAGLVSPEPATSFLQALASQGAWDAFDIIALHPYTDPRSPEEGQIAAAGIGQVKVLAERLGSKPIWVTEYGWSTGAGDRGGNRVSAEAQANYLVRGAAMLRAAGAERVLWYNLKDVNVGDGLGLIGYGGGRTDYGSSKPALQAFRTLNQQLAGATPAGMLDLGQRNVVFDFEDFGTWRRGNQPNGTFTQSTTQVYRGQFAGQLSYSFPTSGNDYVVFTAGAPPLIPSNTTQLGMWVYGDGSGHALKVWLRDAEGETLQFRVGFVGAPGWQFLAVPLSGQVEAYNRVSGGGNLRLDLPARLVAIVLDDEPDRATGSGTIYLDDVTALSGPAAYGARFLRDGAAIDVLWAPQPTEVALPTGAAQGTRVTMAGAAQNEPARNGQFVLGLGPEPIVLRHAPGQPQPAPQPQPQPVQPIPTDQRCFPETGFCIAGRIRTFWEQNGGLPVFGYPIGPQREAQIEAETLQVQWFERNRLELHPGNAPPYDVLLGRLGADRLAQQERDWSQFPQTTAQANCRFFPETGHNVCGEILTAWRANGLEFDGRGGTSDAESLALFGLPLSGPQVETLSDGRQYTVQWFERARFELHPENAPPYNVLLGRLGNEIQE